jgi:F-type H+-transporting ATPase subunit b
MPAPFLLLVANERPLINIDVTLLLNLGVWLALFFFLRAVLWKPMLDLIEAREAGTEGARKSAARLEHDAKDLRERLSKELTAARLAAAGERDVLRAEGAKRDAELTAKVRDEVNAHVERQRAEIAVQKQKVRGEIMALVPSLASDIATKVLRREVRP